MSKSRMPEMKESTFFNGGDTFNIQIESLPKENLDG